MSEFLFRNFQLLVCCGFLHQLSVTEISDPFCHSVWAAVQQQLYHIHQATCCRSCQDLLTLTLKSIVFMIFVRLPTQKECIVGGLVLYDHYLLHPAGIESVVLGTDD
jgi:hypothetical protein